MHFSLTHPDKAQLFETKEKADLQCPSDTGSITYQSVYSPSYKGWAIQRRHGGNITGYLENDDA